MQALPLSLPLASMQPQNSPCLHWAIPPPPSLLINIRCTAQWINLWAYRKDE